MRNSTVLLNFFYWNVFFVYCYRLLIYGNCKLFWNLSGKSQGIVEIMSVLHDFVKIGSLSMVVRSYISAIYYTKVKFKSVICQNVLLYLKIEFHVKLEPVYFYDQHL